MRYVFILSIACFSLTASSQTLADFENQLYNKLNANHGWGLNANKDNGKTELFYTTYAWFNFTPDKKLSYSKTELAIVNDKPGEPKTSTTTFRLTDIKSFEYKEFEYKEYKGDAPVIQENIKSPRLIINYNAGGEIHKLTIGYHLKGKPNLIQELNGLIKEIQKRL